MTDELLGKYKLVLGLEVHIQPKTKHKMFCGCSADIWEAKANTHTCPVCLGLPGALPVPNYEAVEKTHLLGVALNCVLHKNSRFDRKHYFYPDLPKGYQISQYKQPLCGEGYLELDSGKTAQIERIHLEEDAAKSFHEGSKTLVDFNKGGMPLIELVTKPTFTTVEDAVDFCKKLQRIVQLLGISSADMEKGQMRLEPNISLRTAEMEAKDELPKYKVEVKNINSFRFMEKVVRYEIKRQQEVLEGGGEVAQENRGYDENTGKTVSQRGKEEAHDYRYFPEPDIPPMEFTDEYFAGLKAKLPELPMQMRKRFIADYGLGADAAKLLTEGFADLSMSQKFEELAKSGLDPKRVSNLLLNKKDFQGLSVAEFKKKLEEAGGGITDEALLKEAVTKVITENPKVVADYKSGKENAVQFLIGMVMRETQGKASAEVVKKLILDSLKN